MKNKLQKLMGMALALCMAVVMLCGGLADVQAAGYKKSFTKTITVKGGQCVVEMDVKKDTAVTVSISTTSKKKNLNVQATIGGAYEGIHEGDPYFVNLDSKKKKGSFKVNVSKGTRYLYISNLSSGSVKVKVKVSAKKKVLKYVKQEQNEDVG